MARKSLLARPFDLLVCVFYGVQVPIAIFLDSQAVLPHEWYPKAALDMNRWYLEQYRDPLMTQKPAWFLGLGYLELCVQLPFWVLAVYAYGAGRQWIRLPGLIFAFCSLSIMVPILSELLLTQQHDFDRRTLLQFYAPFALMPALIILKTVLCDDLRLTVRAKAD